MDERVTELLDHYALLVRGGDEAAMAIAIAIAVEDSLGIVLPDEALDGEHLGSPEALRDFLETLEKG